MEAITTPAEHKEHVLEAGCATEPLLSLTEGFEPTSSLRARLGTAVRSALHWLRSTWLGGLLTVLFVLAILASICASAVLGYDKELVRLDTDIAISDASISTGGIIMTGYLSNIDLTASPSLILQIQDFTANGTYGLPNITDGESNLYANVAIYQNGMGSRPVLNYSKVVGNVLAQGVSVKINLVGVVSSEAGYIDRESVSSFNRPTFASYPFDRYIAQSMWGARDVDTGRAIPWAAARIVGNIQGWSTDYAQAPTQFATPDGFQWDADNGVWMAFVVERAMAVKAFALTAAATMWLVTLLILWFTLMVIIYNWSLPVNFIVVPASVLFALPALRSIMPGVPPFGTFLDMCSILLCEAIVGLCFVLCTIVWTYRSRVKHFSSA